MSIKKLQIIGNMGVEVDSTLTQSGQAADAKAVGDALAEKASYDDIQRYIDEAILGGEW